MIFRRRRNNKAIKRGITCQRKCLFFVQRELLIFLGGNASFLWRMLLILKWLFGFFSADLDKFSGATTTWFLLGILNVISRNFVKAIVSGNQCRLSMLRVCQTDKLVADDDDDRRMSPPFDFFECLTLTGCISSSSPQLIVTAPSKLWYLSATLSGLKGRRRRRQKIQVPKAKREWYHVFLYIDWLEILSFQQILLILSNWRGGGNLSSGF